MARCLLKTSCRWNQNLYSKIVNNTCVSAFSDVNNLKFPSVSSWNVHHMQYIGIQYDRNPTELSEFMNTVKGHLQMDDHKLLQKYQHFYSIYKTFHEKMKEVLPYSFDLIRSAGKWKLGENRRTNMENTAKVLKTVDKLIYKEIGNHGSVSDLDSQRSQVKILELYIMLKKFMDFYSYILTSAEFGELVKLRKKDMEDLLYRFTRMFFLDPSQSTGTLQKIILGNQTVGGAKAGRFPVIRTNPHYKGRKSASLMVISEVKLDTIPKDNTIPFSIMSAPGDGCYQHVGDLLMEWPVSLLKDGVMGILCFSTQVIFTFMKMEKQQYAMLQEHGRHVVGERVPIIYTKPYNYFILEDRVEIAELLFWLGFVQSTLNELHKNNID